LDLLKKFKKMERVLKKHKPEHTLIFKRVTELFKQSLYMRKANSKTYMDVYNLVFARDEDEQLVNLKTIHQVLYNEMCIALRLNSVRAVTARIPFVRPMLWEPYKLLRLYGFPKDVAWSILEYAEFVFVPTEKRMLRACKTVFNSTTYLSEYFLSNNRIWPKNKENKALSWGDELAEFILRAAKINAPLNFNYSF
jgi:hypothetical protein